MPMRLVHLYTLCLKCLVKIVTVVSYLMKCQSEKMYALTTNLTALRVFEDLGNQNVTCNTANHTLGFMSMVSVKSGSKQWPTSLLMEAQRLRGLCSF
jgi:hypothetical protein